jgi:hypothetical protein
MACKCGCLITNYSLAAGGRAVLYSMINNRQAMNTTSEHCLPHPMLPLVAACGATASRHKA